MTNPDVLQEDASSSLVLQFHQLLCVLPFLVGLVEEELGKVVQCDVVTVKVVGLRKNKKRFNTTDDAKIGHIASLVNQKSSFHIKEMQNFPFSGKAEGGMHDHYKYYWVSIYTKINADR